ncbi:MAG: flagellar motor switch protein FliG [Pararhodobacter sp.]
MPQDSPASGVTLPRNTALTPVAGLRPAQRNTASHQGAAQRASGAQRMNAAGSGGDSQYGVSLTGRQKAAILVRLLLEEGAELPLFSLPETMQTDLTEEMAQLRLVDRATLTDVVREFVETLEQVGLSFSGGIEGALAALGNRLSPAAADRLRQIARARGTANPWDRITQADDAVLLPILAGESAQVAAVVLSKLDVAKAAGLLGQMAGDRARRIACAMPLTEQVAPRVVSRIGESLASQLDDRPRPAFAAPPGERFGAILNAVSAQTRDSLLQELEGADADFADSVRKNIFTFAHIPTRINPRDVPRILRDVPQDRLIIAFAAALAQANSAEADTAEFMLANMSQRLATSLRDEIAGTGRIKPQEAESAQSEVVAAIRALLDEGLITLADESG